MFGSTPATTGSTLGRSASFSFSQPPANKPFSGSSGGFSFGGGAANTNTATSTAPGATGAAAPAAGGFSFGAKPATTTAAPATRGGLFGSSTNTQQQQPQQQQSGFGGGLFGASNNNTASTSTGGLFGKPAAAPATGGFSFGGNNNSNTASTFTGGLFGSSTQPAQPQQQQQQQQPSTSLFSFGSSQPQQQQQQANNPLQFQSQPSFNQPAASPFARFGYFQKERFNDLPDDARRLIEELDTHISAQTQLRDELKTKNFGEEIRKCAAEWHELDSALKSLSATLDTDENQAVDVGRLLERDRATTSSLYSIIVNAKEPRADGASFAEWLERFFADLAVEYRERISRYSSTVETIQHHLGSLNSRESYTPQAIEDAIHAQHESFMALAAQVAALHGEVESLKKDYARWYKQVNKSVRDPFGSMNAVAGSVPGA